MRASLWGIPCPYLFFQYQKPPAIKILGGFSWGGKFTPQNVGPKSRKPPRIASTWGRGGEGWIHQPNLDRDKMSSGVPFSLSLSSSPPLLPFPFLPTPPASFPRPSRTSLALYSHLLPSSPLILGGFSFGGVFYPPEYKKPHRMLSNQKPLQKKV